MECSRREWVESENKKIGVVKLRELTYLFFFAAFFFFAAMEIRLLNVNVMDSGAFDI